MSLDDSKKQQGSDIHCQLFGVLVSLFSRLQAHYNGLQKANEDFLKAIIRYSQFKEIHLFLDDQHVSPFRQEWQACIDQYGRNKQIKIVPISHLPEYLSRYQYSVFHKGDPYISDLAGLREQYSDYLFPITGRAHTLSFDSYLSKSRDLILSSVKSCDAILCSSQAQQRVMDRLLGSAAEELSVFANKTVEFAGQLSLLPLGENGDFANSLDKNQVRDILGYPADQTLLLCVGRFSPFDKMDLHPLLLAANEIVEDRGITDFILILAGNGDASSDYIKSLLSQAYELNLERRIRFELSVDEERKDLLLQAADLFVSVADNVQESFGLAPLEAMNYGLPVVLSDWNGYRELVENGKSGFLIETLSADHDSLSQGISVIQPQQAHLIEAQGTAIAIDSLVNSLERLIQDKSLRTKIGQAAKSRVQDHYHWPLVFDQYHKIVEQLNKKAAELDSQSDKPAGFSFEKVFGHYPSVVLKNSHYLLTTDRAIRVLLMMEKGFHFREIHHLLDQRQVMDVVLFCIGGKTVKEVRQQFPDNKERLWFVLLWMCKYQLLSTSDSKPQSSSASQTSSYLKRANIEDQAGVTDVLKNSASERRDYLSPVLNWIAKTLSPLIQPLDSSRGQLIQSLLASQAALIDEKVLQAIGWYAEDNGLASYQKTLDLLNKQGGLYALQDAYPGWSRLGRKMVVSLCQGVKHLFRRLQDDLPEINGSFESLWDKPATKVIDIVLPAVDKGVSTAIISFDNNEKLVYKARDIQIDALIVGDDGNSLASQLNHWLGDFPGPGTYKMLPKLEHLSEKHCFYGYTQYIHSRPEIQELSNAEARDYHRRLGVITGLAILLGLSDLHQLNVISAKGTPYLIDLEKAFHGGVFKALEQELRSPATAFIQGITDTSFEKTRLADIWQLFHSTRPKLSAVGINKDAFEDAEHGEIQEIYSNFIKTSVSHSLLYKSGPAAQYAMDITEGIKVVIHTLRDHSGQWLSFLDRCKELQVIFQPMVGQLAVRQQLRDLHVFKGFQEFSLRRTRHYLQRVATHLCLSGQESQCWLSEEWREPMIRLSGAFVAPWLEGKVVSLVRYPGKPEVLVRTALGDLRPVDSGEDYFQVDAVHKAKQLFQQLVADIDNGGMFLEHFTAMIQRWLREELQPGIGLPGEIRKNLLARTS